MVRKSARFLAPVALAAVAVGAYLIVHSNTTTMGTGHHGGTAVHVHHHAKPHHKAAAGKTDFYTVKSGDTLSEISSRTGVAIPKIARLNPKLKPPYALQTGQRLRLRR